MTPTTSELSRLLFGPDRRLHGPWRALVADPAMHRRPDTPAADQIDASYRRLKELNARTDPVALAADPRQLAALHEWTGVVDGGLTVLAGIHFNLFLGTLLDHDPSPKRPLDDYLRMDRIGTFLCTELGHGNDAAALETVADYDRTDRSFTLHTPGPSARKFMPNTGPAGGPKSAVVAARLRVEGRDHGIFLFLTPLTDEDGGPLPGVAVRPLPQRPGSPVDHCVTSFDRLRLPYEALLTGAHGRLADDGTLTSAYGSRRKRFLTAIGRVTTGKLCMSAGALGAARAALATAVRYAQHREVTGARPDRRVPVWTHRTHHGPLLEGLATAYAMTALHRATVERWAAHDPADPEASAAAERQVAVTKGWTTWQARDLIIEARERCGAQGLLPVNGITSYAADIEGTITAEGDNLALWAKAGAELLLESEPQAPTGPTGPTGPTDPGAPGDLDDPAVRQRLLRAAVRLRLARARTRLREAPAGDGQRRWNAAAPDALAAVTAHAEHEAAAALLAWAGAARDDTARALLHDLHRLFTLRRIDAYGTLLLGAGELTPGQAAALPDVQERSLGRLAEHALALVDAFDLPDAFYAARPITGRAYQDALAFVSVRSG
ncbi:acyl-CoA dehydrogenase [Streptomyces sp. NRRL WC-3742]|uniref:acyl-CoA dehydrogenase family protein n=1 Tax=Streptomyces sp. NRRL WC-3742 TaxID=1463934 RepID=UPI00068C9979|nr:acyl-CoA dehydrogenase [Streptomyces sp. NRRL WC-3742]